MTHQQDTPYLSSHFYPNIGPAHDHDLAYADPGTFG